MHANSRYKIIKSLRAKLHNSIVRKMNSLGFCTSPEIVETFKRWYLWDYHNVETSKSLNEAQLSDAINNLQLIRKESALAAIQTKYQKFSSDRDLLKCSNGQVRNIHAVGLHRLNLSRDALKKYIIETVGREVFSWDMTIQEAHQCIQRLEKWEAKALKEKR